REHVFKGEDTVNEFCKWLFSRENKGVTCLCHNFQGYDSYFIMQYLHNNGVIPKVIMNGAKLLSVEVESMKIRLIDSLAFLPMPLAQLPGTFGLKELAKGYFPHLYNTQANQNAVLDHLPDVSFYGPDGMKPKARQDFLKWYDEHKHDRFDLQAELLKYCRSDVDILRRCCLEFRNVFIEQTTLKMMDGLDPTEGVDPFKNCITIASACNLVFRSVFLKNETIALIPPQGYTPEHNQSVKALKWMKWYAHTHKVTVQHARNGGEKTIGPYRVDGYYEQGGQKVVLEFMGDFFHGNPKVYKPDTVNCINNQKMGDLYQKTLDKKRYFKTEGYTYVEMWESDYDRELKTNKDMRTYVDKQNITEPLQPRDAFFGGRTECFKLFHEAEEGQKIRYVDFTSLYPYVNKYKKYPVGHPTIITENFQHLDNYEGLIKCKILAPKHLYLPLLPAKMNNKLMFACCKTCAETLNQGNCSHTQEERAFVGTWVTDEVKKALELGYEILEMYEIWHFEEISQYNPETLKGGLFSQYIDCFLKLKQEASGWPGWCTDDGKKRAYVRKYLENEGIMLDEKNIEKNPGKRALAKLMLNSFWGKFGQNCNKTQVTYITDPKEYFDLLLDDTVEVTNIRYIGEETVEMTWHYKDQFVQASNKVNVIIAAYTTAHARLKLYSVLEQLGDRALYADTDSVIFTTKEQDCLSTSNEGEWEPKLGDYLGELTDELDEGDHIVTFVSGGPKNYAYKTAKGKECCKVRGITLNHRNGLQINYETVERLVKHVGEKEVVTVQDPCKITRARDTFDIVSKEQKKDYRIVFDKRIITEDFYTLPYGYL
ncbi:MAG: hypothetical protein MJA29_13455, partial [Candidatus Omnitrophica bacterium]|nr:hypothetical protein [Candidatus Omnitrophota bacterium]